MNWIVADDDSLYLALLQEYCRDSERCRGMALQTFSSPAALEEHLSAADSADIVICSPLFMKTAEQASCRRIVCLEEQPVPEGARDRIHKYQPLNRLLDALLIAEQPAGGAGEHTPGKGKVVTLHSASGGSGKSTVSFHLCVQLALLDCRVVCLSLESYSALGALLGGQRGKRGLEQLVYALQTGQEVGAEQLEQWRSREARFGFDYFETPLREKELAAMSPEAAEQLIQFFAERYDYVVVDGESTLHGRMLGAMRASDQIWWLLTEDRQCLAKSAVMLQDLRERLPGAPGQEGEAADSPAPDGWTAHEPLAVPGPLEGTGRIRFVLNKHMGTRAVRYEESGICLSGRLPYVPEWKAAPSPEAWLEASMFKQGMMELISSLLIDSGGMRY